MGRTHLDAFRFLVQFTHEAEQLHERLAGRGQGVARGNGRLGLHVDDEAIEVGALLDTRRLDLVGHLDDGRVDRVDRNARDLGLRILVLSADT